MSITPGAIQRANPGDILRDDRVPGLHLRVSAKGKSFYLYYRTRDGKERRPKIGDLSVVSLAKARSIAKDLLGEVSAGRDPAGDRQEARAAPTVNDLCDRYIQDYLPAKKSVKEFTRQINSYIRPKFGRMKVLDVQYEDICDFHARMADRPTQANRVLAVLSKMFNLAEKWKLRPQHSNPCRHVTRYRENKRRRYITVEEAPRIAEVLKKYAEARPRSVAFIWLLMFTGARPSEIASARWEWVEHRPSGAVLHLPDSKTGARDIYLPPQVLVLLKDLPRPKSGTLTGINNPRMTWDKVREEAGCPDLRLYDLRHSFASSALRAGYSLAAIAELLGHRYTETTKRYAHLADDLAHEAAARTGDLIDEMMNAKDTPAA